MTSTPNPFSYMWGVDPETISPETATQAPMAVYGDSVDGKTCPPSESVDIPPRENTPLTGDGHEAGLAESFPVALIKIAEDVVALTMGKPRVEAVRHVVRSLLAVRDRCADVVRYDDNHRLDRFYCCPAMEQGVQVCACEGVSIRNEMISQIEGNGFVVPAHPGMGGA